MRKYEKTIAFLLILASLSLNCYAAEAVAQKNKSFVPARNINESELAQTKDTNKNKPERLEWFRDLALGMFIGWNVSSELGTVGGHTMVGASDDYLDRYINYLPTLMNPRDLEPARWADLAKMVGMKYMVLFTKHHDGFCMWNTKTTNFSIMHTPYARDFTHEVLGAFRDQGIAIGLYLSPDDFWFIHQQGFKDISRCDPNANPANNPELMAHNKEQIRELLTNYGPIDTMFLDAFSVNKNSIPPLRQLCWQLQPDIIVTRGAMPTPEQRLPDKPPKEPWEACMSIGNQWQHKATNEDLPTGTELIEKLIKTRAGGGNLLLGIGPDPDGVFPPDEVALLRELGLWTFVNHKAIYKVRPWHIMQEGNIWFTKAKDTDTVYAFVTGKPWPYGQRNTITIKSVRATDKTDVEILGQTGRIREYKPEVDAKGKWEQDEKGLHISAMRTQRLYTNFRWPNPVVIKITHAKPVK
ncbi:MAG: alpha-L-fucosidase [Planctomycetota bacterium]|jgi:alpha-L-fucosidase